MSFLMFLWLILFAYFLKNRFDDAIRKLQIEEDIRRKVSERIRKKKIDKLYGRE